MDLPQYLVRIEEISRVVDVLTSYKFIEIKTNGRGVSNLIRDYNQCLEIIHPEDQSDSMDFEAIRLLRNSLHLSAYALSQDSKQLAAQLMGRLQREKNGRVLNCLKSIDSRKLFGYLCPVSQSLQNPREHERGVLGTHEGRTYSVVVSAKEEFVLSCGEDGCLKCWDIEAGDIAWSMALGGKTGIVCNYGDDNVLYNAGKAVEIVEISTGQIREHLPHGLENVQKIAANPSQSIVLLATKNGIIHAVCMKRGKELYSLRGHTNDVETIAITSDGQTAITGSEDNEIRIWCLQKQDCKAILKEHSSVVSSVDISPSGKLLASCSWDKKVIVWDIVDMKPIHVFEGHSDFPTVVKFINDNQLVSGAWDRTIRIWDLERNQKEKVLKGHSDWILDIGIIKHNQQIVTASSDHTIRIWELNQTI